MISMPSTDNKYREEKKTNKMKPGPRSWREIKQSLQQKAPKTEPDDDEKKKKKKKEDDKKEKSSHRGLYQFTVNRCIALTDTEDKQFICVLRAYRDHIRAATTATVGVGWHVCSTMCTWLPVRGGDQYELYLCQYSGIVHQCGASMCGRLIEQANARVCELTGFAYDVGPERFMTSSRGSKWTRQDEYDEEGVLGDSEALGGDQDGYDGIDDHHDREGGDEEDEEREREQEQEQDRDQEDEKDETGMEQPIRATKDHHSGDDNGDEERVEEEETQQMNDDDDDDDDAFERRLEGCEPRAKKARISSNDDGQPIAPSIVTVAIVGKKSTMDPAIWFAKARTVAQSFIVSGSESDKDRAAVLCMRLWSIINSTGAYSGSRTITNFEQHCRAVITLHSKIGIKRSDGTIVIPRSTNPELRVHRPARGAGTYTAAISMLQRSLAKVSSIHFLH
jgi:hypothetical protein